MKEAKRLCRIAEIVDLVFAGLYTFFTAYAFSLRDNLYWMFLVFALLTLFGGLGFSSYVYRFPLDSKKNRISLVNWFFLFSRFLF